MLGQDVCAFLAGPGTDRAGRSIESVLGFGDGALESHHDYIQWLFPLAEASRAVLGSPVLTDNEIEVIRHDHLAQQNLGRAAAVMTGFYARQSHWLVRHDHNHLRITRIIRSLRLLRGPEDARAFLDAVLARVEAAGRPVSKVSLDFWRNAADVEES